MTIDPLSITSKIISSYDEVKQALEHYRKEQAYCESEYNDIAHALELTNFNASEGYKLAKQMQESRLRRRQAKNMIEQLETLMKTFKKHKSLCNELKDAHAQIQLTIGSQKKRSYRPRVREDLFERVAR
ncbi:hypothetical protein [Chengkuizengella axinellae]|uniref:Uncharacterized protein n=1 Tax=Chengkuizengella axinellae TaxID=3064388 RepID=A0ABT9J6B0_9BACL|nr:hypothetical protein [Chengkuizengella sp. 2205SS18-9]MDP5277162.1 hypothetical protein [Chengkuizengella sp. 2205SS18-9]